MLLATILLAMVFTWVGVTQANEAPSFAIRVVDSQSGRGVPLVQLKTVNDVSYWSDSLGYIALDEPGLVGREVYFHVQSHGYELPADGFGYRGVRLRIEPGGEAIVRVNRRNIAQRLYRVTGEGIYRDAVRLNKPVPIAKPLLNSDVMGSDSVLTAVYRGQLYWFWGDTNLAKYPLGVFDTTGAVSQLPSSGGLRFDEGVNLQYFVDKNNVARAVCKMPGNGPTWIQGLTVLGTDEPKMFAGYAKIKPPLEVYERGIAQWDETSQSFKHSMKFPTNQQGFPSGHPVLDASGGVEHSGGAQYVYYCDPLPHVRVPANRESLLDASKYEVYGFLKASSDAELATVQRDERGELVWKWRRDGVLLTRDLEDRLVREKRLAPHERALSMATLNSDRRWTLHTSSIAWNDYRSRWVMIGLEAGGESSYLGEVYYLESEDLQGPWSPAVKIVTHDEYSFYNPRLHPMASDADEAVVYFEGTYTRTFSRAKEATPRYDYNQIMYRLDLTDERLR